MRTEIQLTDSLPLWGNGEIDRKTYTQKERKHLYNGEDQFQ